MKHLGWAGINYCIFFLITIISFISFGYMISAEEYVSHPIVTEYVEVNPDNDLKWFSFYLIISEMLFCLLSFYQKGTYLSKSLISLSIIIFQLLICLYPYTLFIVDYPLTVMRSITTVASIIVIIIAGINLYRNLKQTRKYYRRRYKLIMRDSQGRQ